MKGQDRYSRNWKRIVGTGVAGFALASLVCSLGGVAERDCTSHYGTAWVAVEVLRHVVQACWQLVPAYLFEDSGPCQHLFQIVASVWPVLCVIAG
jgi:hypothetical protein